MTTALPTRFVRTWGYHIDIFHVIGLRPVPMGRIIYSRFVRKNIRDVFDQIEKTAISIFYKRGM